VDSPAVSAALARCRIAQTAPRREGYVAFNARHIAREIAAQTKANPVDVLFELRVWAVAVGGAVKLRASDGRPTTPRPLFLYVPARLVSDAD